MSSAAQLLPGIFHVNTAVILIDNDLAFAFWLAKALDQAGYEAFPARSVPDAIALLADMPMNPRLLILGGPPAGADALVARWRIRHKDLRVMSLVDDSDLMMYNPFFGVDLECRKPVGRKEEDRAELLLAVDHICASEPARL